MNIGRRLVAVALVGALSASGCGDDGATTKAGGDAPPIVLRIGTDDVPGRPAADQIDEFARHVDDLSGGALQIEPVWQAAGEGRDDWDQAVAQLVIDGDLEMGNIPSRSWDTLGVTSLRALHAPFLVATDRLLAAVVADDALAAELLAGLDDAGVTGLALVPEGLRHVFSFGAPLLSPDDFDGLVVRAPTSATSFSLFEALGATADDFGGPGDHFMRGVADGTIGAAESSFVFAGSLPAATTVTGNLTPYPKVNVIVINADVFGALSDGNQGVLRDAALATRDRAIDNNRDDADYAPEFCANGGTIVLVSNADLAALQEATSVAYDELEADGTTAAAIARIRELAENIGPTAPVEECPGASESMGAAASASEAGPAATDEFPGGIYRTEMMFDDLRERGLEPGLARGMSGINMLTIADGRWRHSIFGHEDDDCFGTYTVDDGRIRLILTPACGGTPAGYSLFEAAWVLDSDELTFVDVSSDLDSDTFEDAFVDMTWGGQPWTRIGDAEPVATGEFPDGAYRMEITADFLMAAGVDRTVAFDHAGTWTLTFDDGNLTVIDNALFGRADPGVYCVESGRVSLGLLDDPPVCGDFWSAAWKLDGDQLQFIDVRSGHGFDLLIETLFGGVPFTRID